MEKPKRVAAKDPILFRGSQANLFAYVDSVGKALGLNPYVYTGGDPVNYSDRFGLARIPWYIPNSTVVKYARSMAGDFGYDLSRISDKQILAFIAWIPQNEADDFIASYDRRPEVARNEAERAMNLQEYNFEQTLILKWLRGYGIDPCTIRKKK